MPGVPEQSFEVGMPVNVAVTIARIAVTIAVTDTDAIVVGPKTWGPGGREAGKRRTGAPFRRSA